MRVFSVELRLERGENVLRIQAARRRSGAQLYRAARDRRDIRLQRGNPAADGAPDFSADSDGHDRADSGPNSRSNNDSNGCANRNSDSGSGGV